jgi:hypothetical protein
MEEDEFVEENGPPLACLKKKAKALDVDAENETPTLIKEGG